MQINTRGQQWGAAESHRETERSSGCRSLQPAVAVITKMRHQPHELIAQTYLVNYLKYLRVQPAGNGQQFVISLSFVTFDQALSVMALWRQLTCVAIKYNIMIKAL